MEPSRKDQHSSVLAKVNDLWPTFRYLGMGMWLAWVLLLSDANSWITPASPDDGTAVTGTRPLAIFLTLFFASNALSLAVLSASYRRAERFVCTRRYIVAVGALGIAGAACIILSGPSYLPGRISANMSWMFYAGDVLCGIVSALVFAKCAHLFGQLPPYKVLVYTVLANVTVAFFFFAVISLDFYRPLDGPPLSGMLAIALLPLASAFVLAIGDKKDSETLIRNDSDPDAAHRPCLTLPTTYWRFVSMVFVFSFASMAVFGTCILSQNAVSVHNDSTIVMVLRLCLSIGVLLAAIQAAEAFTFDKVLFAASALTTIVLCTFPIVADNGHGVSIAANTCTQIVDFSVWCLLCFIVHENGWSGIRVNGIGRCIAMAGSALGVAVSATVLANIDKTWQVTAFYVALALVVAFFSVFVFGEKEYRKLFGQHEKKNLELDHIIEQITEERSSRGKKKRRWSQACKAVSEEGKLSAREAEVMEKLSLGKRPNEIAEELFISPNTVRVHVQNVYKKLDIHSQQELAALVREKMRR